MTTPFTDDGTYDLASPEIKALVSIWQHSVERGLIESILAAHEQNCQERILTVPLEQVENLRGQIALLRNIRTRIGKTVRLAQGGDDAPGPADPL